MKSIIFLGKSEPKNGARQENKNRRVQQKIREKRT